MIRSELEHRRAVEQLQQTELFNQMRREQQEGLGFGVVELERAIAPLLSFQAQIAEEIASFQ